MREYHQEFDGTIGVRRMTIELNEKADQPINHKRVERLMRTHNIVGVNLRKPKKTTVKDQGARVVDDFLKRKFRAEAPNQVYVGDITSEENEMSWIIQTGYAPLLAAFPQLESLRIRGSDRLDIAPIQHAHLAELAIETGGMPSKIVTAIAKSTLPALKHLELWLGDDNYGFDGDLKTYADLLAAIDPSRLTYLGLRNAQISDELAVHVAAQPWLARLETLDLSMGTIGDAGARALHDSPHVRSLKRLDLSHHYIGEEWQRKLAAMPLTVVLDDPQDVEDTDGDRYVEVGE